ncbi:alpha/beta fold hydrolase [Saccharopolyspora taberi]|uniref:AB hydrolase-1 domain-containing protein n=1 Tax=Saccharopolyspora taberi TaxID=60895 RepID=A0ABN3VFX5_9PSEU
MESEFLLTGGEIPIRVRDHGGTGSPVLLLHGAGGELDAWDGFAPLLTGSHRVVALDLRGHGKSGDGPWEWASVLADIESAVDGVGLENPAVVGHSLGGMLAAMWARRRPDCPAAVSLDGHRSSVTDPRNYAGLPADQVARDRARLAELFAAQLEAVRRPAPEVLSAIQQSPEFADCLPVFAEVESPFLVALATRDLPGMPAEFAGLMSAFRAGLRRDLAELRDRRPNIRVAEVDASHAMVFEDPEAVAGLVLGFLNR